MISLARLFLPTPTPSGEGDRSVTHKSRDARKRVVDTAVRRLNASVSKTHEITAALKESYREAAESSKLVVECLLRPQPLEPASRHQDERQDMP